MHLTILKYDDDILPYINDNMIVKGYYLKILYSWNVFKDWILLVDSVVRKYEIVPLA